VQNDHGAHGVGITTIFGPANVGVEPICAISDRVLICSHRSLPDGRVARSPVCDDDLVEGPSVGRPAEDEANCSCEDNAQGHVKGSSLIPPRNKDSWAPEGKHLT